MSVVRRLWRRAPAWRLLLFVAVACTGLAAMFPPHLPASLLRRPAVPSGPRYVPPAGGPRTPPYTEIFMPAITATRQIMIPFAGRQVPLPRGQWSEIALMRAVGPVSEQGMVLARLQSGRMTGMVVLLGTPATQREAPIPQAACVDPTGGPVHVLTPPGERDQALQECWSVRLLATSDLVQSHHPMESRAFARLGKLDIAVPAHLIASIYFRHDDHGAIGVNILLPDPTQNASLLRRVGAWMRRWVPLLHRGFDGGLTEAQVTGTLARDP